MVRYGKYNNGYKHILILIDILSRFAWTYALKSLTGKEMKEALQVVLKNPIKKLRTDSGSEFANGTVKAFLQSKGIDHFTTLNEKKANYAERLIQTLKTKITKYMPKNGTYEWVNVLPPVTSSYNKTYHRSIQMTPTQAMNTDDVTLWNLQYNPVAVKKRPISSKPPKDKSPYSFKEGDKVKLSFIKSKFDR